MRAQDRRILILLGVLAAILVGAFGVPAAFRLATGVGGDYGAELRDRRREDSERTASAQPSLSQIGFGASSSRSQRIEGIVTNNGTGSIAFVKVRCAAVHRRTGKEADADITYAVGEEGLPPGSDRAWTVYLDALPEDWTAYRASCQVMDYRRPGG